MAKKLTANLVSEISYRCELYKDIEESVIRGFWTGEVDSWGKLTVQVTDVLWTENDELRIGSVLYLFPRELVNVAKVVR